MNSEWMYLDSAHAFDKLTADSVVATKKLLKETEYYTNKPFIDIGVGTKGVTKFLLGKGLKVRCQCLDLQC